MDYNRAVGIVLASWVGMQCLTCAAYPLIASIVSKRPLCLIPIQLVVSLTISLILVLVKGGSGG